MPDTLTASGIATLEAFGTSEATQDDTSWTYTKASRTHPVQLVTLEWTSNAGGTASATSRALYGVFNRAVFVPGTGDDAPTDDYDVTVLDEHGFDILEGNAANRDTANTEEVVPTSLNRAIAGEVTAHISNAGDTKSGTIYLYFTDVVI